MSRFLRYWLPVLVWMSMIFYLSSQSRLPVEMPYWVPYVDKLAHAAVFGILGFLFIRAWLEGKLEAVNTRVVAFAVLFTALYGITDEIHQMFVPGRSPAVGDVIADALGAAVFGAVLYKWKKRTREAPAV
ncbi:MAG TPA: VanZ family protein [bacterium]|nr:VanZ family protein [Candidatus Omnitrophota bacterium]HOJ58831.1 VanZ family protein [bacterium]HOL95660.1 VanZ family protein [bacterium]HPP02137.1 VanZ family protein [bacterium]HXK93397.1 VanZ family protein [bacterium]